jgi:hypothetical protein
VIIGNKKVLFFGAGEGIRTLDFNLGKDKVVASTPPFTLILL